MREKNDYTVQVKGADVMALAGREMRTLITMSTHLEEGLSKLIELSGAQSPENIYRLQSLDLMMQILADLAKTLDFLAMEMDDDWSVNFVSLSREIRLNDLANRLNASIGDEGEVKQVEQSGDCQFF